MDDTDKFERIPDEDLLTLVQKQTFKHFWDFGHEYSEWRANVLLRAMSLLPVVLALRDGYAGSC